MFSINLWLVSTLCAAILAAPAIINGAPFVYFDTDAYLDGARAAIHAIGSSVGLNFPNQSITPHASVVGDGLVISGRSVYYGIPAYTGNITSDLWDVVILQGVVVAALIVMFLRQIAPAGWRPAAIAASAALGLFTSAGFFVGLAMPDIWVGCMTLALAMSIVWWRAFDASARAFLAFVVAFAALAHASHMLLLAVMLALAGFGWAMAPRLRGWLAAPALLTGGACLAVALLGAAAFHGAVAWRYGAPPISRPHLTAHLMDGGPGVAYANAACPDAGYALCGFLDRTPAEWRAFLFEKNAEKGIFAAAPPDIQRRLADEQIGFALDVLRAAPLETTLFFLKSGVEQLGRYSISGIALGPGSERFLVENFDGPIVDATRSSLSYRSSGLIDGLDRTSTWATTAAALALLGCLAIPAARRRLDDRFVALAAICLLAIVANAGICGALASPYDRFQARIIWLAPLLAFGAATLLTQSRRARPATADVSSPQHA